LRRNAKPAQNTDDGSLPVGGGFQSGKSLLQVWLHPWRVGHACSGNWLGDHLVLSLLSVAGRGDLVIAASH